MSGILKPHEILKNHLDLKKKSRPQYSIRALARDLNVSSSYLTAIFSGKKKLPLNRISTLAEKLEMDELGIIKLKQSLVVNELSKEDKAIFLQTQSLGIEKSLDFLQRFKEEGRTHLALWSQWYYIAILDLSTCSNFKSDVEWIARQLSIQISEATRALNFLISSGYLVEKEGRLTKTDLLLRLPATKSNDVIRNFHKQLMKKAVEVMNSQTSQDDFNARLISGLMIAANPEKVQEAKSKLNIALHEIAQLLSTGECTELYQLGVQLFPLTKK